MEYVTKPENFTSGKDSARHVDPTNRGRYKQFRFTLLLVITIFSLIPATIMSVVGYFQYLALIERQELAQLKWHLHYTKEEVSNLFIHETEISLEITEKMANLLTGINKKVLDDTFFIDSEGLIITPSKLFKEGEVFPLSVNGKTDNIIEKNKSFGMGKTFFGTSPINGTPWTLVLVKDGPIHEDEWYIFQLKLVGVFIICTIISLLVIYQLVNILTYRIRISDIKRMTLFSEIGHNNRLATIGRLAAGVAHEINNPLAVIDQKAGLMEDYIDFSDDFPNKEKFKQALAGIESNIKRCKKITHRLLGFARKVDASYEVIDVNNVVKEVLGFLEKEALYNHINLELHLAEPLPDIHSDLGQIQQILLNIINNAIDAIGKNGVITISTTLQKKHTICIEIKDDGPGIDPTVMKHIFDPFFTTKETGKGTGLGLAITYGLITKLGGDIKVRSTPGHETTFSLFFPVNNDKSQQG